MEDCKNFYKQADGILGQPKGKQGRDYLTSPQKRLVDLAIAGTVSAGTLPVVALIATTVWAEDMKYSPFVSIGLPGTEGVEPRVLKIRTMCNGAQKHEMEVAGGQCLAKISNDPRITPIGRKLRVTSLDELPQLWQVLRGEWSMVGLRPLSNADRAWALELGGNLWDTYSALLDKGVKPGVTGFYGIFGRKELTDLGLRVSLEELYAARASLRADLKILALTIPAVLGGRGAR
jgi:lipopolysaccharide/colanic/teichoic acid biosynthesis glycosyltransferase